MTKGEEISSTNYDALCADGRVSIDFKSFMNSGMMNAYSGMNIDPEITGTNLEIPNDINVGDELPDANVTIKMNISGMNMTVKTDITNREVLGMETIETPAGTFECYVLTQTTPPKAWGLPCQPLPNNGLRKVLELLKLKITGEMENWKAKASSLVLVNSFKKFREKRALILLQIIRKSGEATSFYFIHVYLVFPILRSGRSLLSL